MKESFFLVYHIELLDLDLDFACTWIFSFILIRLASNFEMVHEELKVQGS